MNAVTIAAHTCAKYRLRKIVAYIQPEFAPYLLSDIFGAAEMDIRTREKLFHCKYIFAVKRRFLFAENYADSGLRVKAAAISFMVRCDFYKRVQNIFAACFLFDKLLAVNAVHKAHNYSIFANGFTDTFHGRGQCTVFQRNYEQVNSVSFLGSPHLWVIGHMIYRAAFF